MKKFALLVGVERYRDVAITPLQFATSDVTALRQQLIQRCGFDHVCALAENSPDGEPDLIGIVNAFKDMAGELRPDDQFLFYFAGHGIEIDGRGYLLTRDTPQAFPEHGSLSFELLKKTFQRLAAGRRMILLDACRNAPDSARGDSGNPMGEFISRDLVTVARARESSGVTTGLLSSCRTGQRAYEWAAKRHGVFTHYLLEGLEGAAWEGEELLFKRLAAYVQQEVRSWSTNTPGISQPQEPWYEEFGDAVDIVLSSEVAGKSASKASARVLRTGYPMKVEARRPEDEHRRLCVEFVGAERGRKTIIQFGESFTLGRENCIRHDEVDVTIRLLPCRSPELDPANWRRTNMIARRHISIRSRGDHFEIRALDSQSKAQIEEVLDPRANKQYGQLSGLHALFCDSQLSPHDVAPRRWNRSRRRTRAWSPLSAYAWHQVPAQFRITLGNDLVTFAARCYGGDGCGLHAMQLRRENNRPELEYLLASGLIYFGGDPRCPLHLPALGLPPVLAKLERHDGAFCLTRAVHNVPMTVDEREVAPMERVMISLPCRIAFGDYICIARLLEPLDFTE